ncbi:MAG: DUF6268 family outer membrane beta-barrel protein [Bacteroidota bacterium]
MGVFSTYTLANWGYTIALLLCTLTQVQSQNYVDLLKVNAGTTPINTFDSSGNASVLNEYGLDANVPLKINECTTFLTGLSYENFQTKLFPEQKVQSLSGLALKLGVSHNFNEKLTGTLILLPKLSTNFGRIGHKDFQMGGIAFMKLKRKPNLNYRVGLYYNTESFGPLFVPLLGMYYLSTNERFEITAMLPIAADINYKLIRLLNVGVNFNGQTKSYHVTHINPGLKSAYVVRQTNELFAYLRFNLGKTCFVQTKVGQSFGRKFRVYNDDEKVDFALPLTFVNDKRRQLNSNFSNGMVFQVVFVYRLPIPASK